ncbi:hypothetical protein SPRG_05035 [Saprolegnia parasitica CBS 223.65]|uniref:protein O-GlcNAc transferase n=1 Tax=Saprolegnia parasitica (strain CBS 223.65) TaxID=695850 RepID=A0A067CHW3_SAPPC|nr:hypothetical protein SPRG_05035 [Saprolegnia parasitica CBS 223.65]KDO30324.1 hypothetical protein SPRG_05035 [Saprolegnia parasitica CBS 223.65]|eukprot:XP_012198934.1 hypothetical protein SPRG_05035 [Saprolegnia parasitica CBS 223.65]
MWKIAGWAALAWHAAAGFVYPSTPANHAQVIAALEHYALGQQAMAADKLDEATRFYAAAIAAHQAFAPAYNNLGYILGRQRRVTDAIAYHTKAVELASTNGDWETYVSAHNNLGYSARDGKGYAQTLAAIQHYDLALRVRPPLCSNATYLSVLYNKASALCSIGQNDGALPLLLEVLQLDPHHAGALLDLGTIYYYKGDLAAALSQQDKLLRIASTMRDLVGALNNKGQFLKELGLVHDALRLHQQALALDPRDSNTRLNVITARRQLCHWDAADDWHESLLATTLHEIQVRTGQVPSLLPFDATLMPIADDVKKAIATLPMRIGYLSFDFRNHPMGQLTVGAIEHHDKSQTQIYGYSYGPNDGSEWRHRIASACHAFADVARLSDVEIASVIASDRIQILIDLMAHTRGARVGICSLHPAPIVVNYLGYPGTMGAAFTDYAILDAFVVPPTTVKSTFSEKAVYLPHTYQVNDYAWSVETCVENCVSDLMAYEPRAAFVYCNFNTINKMEPTSFDAWMRILRRVPKSVLWLLEPSAVDASVMATFRAEAAARGVDPRRLLFAPRVAKAAHLSRLRHAHLFLDSFVYNAHSTASDMLWTYLPVLTLVGHTFAARVAGSLLRLVNADAASLLTTFTVKEYEDMAVALATTHLQSLQQLRRVLAASTLETRLFDTADTTRHLEASYRLMLELAPARMHLVVHPMARHVDARRHGLDDAIVQDMLAHQSRGEFAIAEVGYRRLLSVRPDHADALHLYGLLLHALDQTPLGLPFLLQSIERMPHVGFYRANFATMLVAAGDKTSALQQCALALHLEPSQPRAFLLFTELLVDAAMHAEVLEAHTRYYPQVARHLSHVERLAHLFHVAYAHAQLGHVHVAIDLLRSTFLQAGGDVPEAFIVKAKHNLGVLLQTIGDFDAANAVAMEAVVAEHRAAHARIALHAPPTPLGGRIVVIYCYEYGQTWWPHWGPSSTRNGVGGSEEAVIYLARALARLGLDVRVYADPLAADLGVDRDGVRWFSHATFDTSAPIDVFVAWRYHISVALAAAANQSFVWLHDVIDGRVFTPAFLASIHGIFCLSRFHANVTQLRHTPKLRLSSNGVTPAAFVIGPNHPHRFVYGSAPTRGLETLLLHWPSLRQSLPHATLDVYYGLTPAVRRTASAEWQRRMEMLLAQDGVVYHGLVDHDTLAHGYANAGFYLYPTTFSETSCVSIIKAMAAGAIPITSKRGALAEVVGQHDMGPATALVDDNQEAWIQDWLRCIVAAARMDPSELTARRTAMVEDARHRFLWSHVAAEWATAFLDST